MRALCLLRLILVLLCGGLSHSLMAATLDENQAKAMLTLNIARYTLWPAAPDSDRSLMTFCVLGDKGIYQAFAGLGNRLVGKHPVKIIRFEKQQVASSCDVIYLATRDRRLITQILTPVQRLPVLTIGETVDFTDYGGVIRVFTDGGRLRFAASNPNARRAGVELSARLLQFASQVEKE